MATPRQSLSQHLLSNKTAPPKTPRCKAQSPMCDSWDYRAEKKDQASLLRGWSPKIEQGVSSHSHKMITCVQHHVYYFFLVIAH